MDDGETLQLAAVSYKSPFLKNQQARKSLGIQNGLPVKYFTSRP